MKGKFLSVMAKLVSVVASKSAGALCLYIFHQPKVPDKLLNK